MKHLKKFEKSDDNEKLSFEEKLLNMKLKLHNESLTLSQKECVIDAMKELTLHFKNKS